MGMYRDIRGNPMRVIVANLSPVTGYEKSFQRSLIIRNGSVTLGVTAVIDPASLKKRADPIDQPIVSTIQRPDEVLPEVLATLEPKSDYQILMVQGTYELAWRLAEENPGFDIVVAASDSIAYAPESPVPIYSMVARPLW